MNFINLKNLSFFGRDESKKNVLPISYQDLSDEYVDLGQKQQEEFIMVEIHEGDIDFLSDLENPKVPEEIVESSSIPKAPEELTSPALKSARQIRWENQYPKIFGTVMNQEGHLLEVRRVNKDKQLAFWDHKKNAQIYVYRTKNSGEFATSERLVFRMKT